MDEFLSFNGPWSKEFSDVLRFWISLLSLAFSLILTVASRLLHPYSTNDKTSRLMVKRFTTVRDTQRGSQLHREEKREEGNRGDQEENRGNQKGREQSRQ